MIRRNIRAAQQEINVLSQSVNWAAISVLPQAYQGNENDDNDFGDTQIVITFSSQQTILFTSNYTSSFSDGTLKVCPNIFFAGVHCAFKARKAYFSMRICASSKSSRSYLYKILLRTF